MLTTPPYGVLQAAAVIAKTTETVILGEIPTAGYKWLNLFLKYTKGDETGVNIYPYVLHTSGGDEYPLAIWTAVAGVYTPVVAKLQLLDTSKRYYLFDIHGIPFVKFYQGGSNNDGTPTGTLAASYTLS